MIDLSRNQKSEIRNQKAEPEEIAVAVIAAMIWLPIAFIIGGLL